MRCHLHSAWAAAAASGARVRRDSNRRVAAWHCFDFFRLVRIACAAHVQQEGQCR